MGSARLAFLVVSSSAVFACTDPPGDPVLIIDLIGDNSRATDITGLGFSPSRVELMISDTVDGEPRLVVVPDSSGKSLKLTFDSSGMAHDFVSLFSPRAGFLHQVRFIEDGVAITGPAAPGGSALAKVPSGLQTGIKISPAAGPPFELQRFRNTRIEVRFDVAHQVNRPKKAEFHFKLSLTAVLRQGPADSLIPLDRVVVAPMVAGAMALVLSRDTALREQPCRLIDRMLRNAGAINGPASSVAGNRLLDADRAVRNPVTQGVRQCP